MTDEFIDEVKRSNPFYAKYADKIDRLARDSTKEDELNRRLESYRKQDVTPSASTAISDDSKHRDSISLPVSHEQSAKPAATASTAATATRDRLDDVMKLELLADKSAVEIADLWLRHHSELPGLAAVMSAQQFADMSARWREYRTFLLPLPRQQGVEFFVVQFENDRAHFTSLINFQAHGENAPECLTLHHYSELMNRNKIVLMRAQYDTQLLTAAEARCLVQELQLYYYRPSCRREQLLETFSRRPEQFRYQDLVEIMHSTGGDDTIVSQKS